MRGIFASLAGAVAGAFGATDVWARLGHWGMYNAGFNRTTSPNKRPARHKQNARKARRK